MSRERRFLRATYRIGMSVVCLLLVLLTLYVVAGRLLTPEIERYRLDIQSALESRLGARVRIDALAGRWEGLSPVIDIAGLRLSPRDGGSTHQIEALSLKPDVFVSLLQRQWRFSEVTVRGLAFDLLEREDGGWHVEDIGLGGGLQDAHLDFLLHTDSLHLSDARLGLQRHDGESLRLEKLNASLYNDGSEHDLNLRLSLPEQPNPLQLSLQLQGDPRQELVMEGYLGIRQTDMMPLVNLLSPALPVALEALTGNAGLWFSRQSDGSLETTLAVDELALVVEETDTTGSSPQRVEALTTTLVLQQRADGEWRLRGQGLEYRHAGERWHQGAFDIMGVPAGPDGPERVSISAETLELAPLQPWLPLLEDLLPQVDIIRTLAPRGTVDTFAMQLTRPAQQSGAGPRFQLQAAVRDFGVDAWQQAPAGDGVDARIEATERGGVAHIDSRDAELHLEQLFAERWHWERVRGDVYWELADGGFRVYSSPLAASNGHVDARVQFEIDNRRESDGEPVTDLGLNLGIRQMDAAYHSRYLPLLPELGPTLEWLEQALLGGEIRDSGLIFRGSVLSDPPPGSQSTLARFKADDVELAFQEGWPHLSDAIADIRVQQGDVDIRVDSAALAGIQLENANGRVRQGETGPYLALDASAATDTGSGLDFLRETPVRDALGEALDDWEASGQLELEMDLRLGLGAEELAPVIDLWISSRGSRLRMHDLDLDISELDGELYYSTEGGLQARSLQGSLFGRPLATDIDSVTTEGEMETLVIRSRGAVSGSALRDWSGQTELAQRLLGHVEGESDFRSEVRLYPRAGEQERRVSLEIRSPLTGMSLSLPAPFQKTTTSEQSFTLGLEFFEDRDVLQADLADIASARLLLREGELAGGRLWMGGFTLDEEAPSSHWRPEEFVLLGELEQLDVRAWQDLIGTFREPESAPSPLLTRLALAELDVQSLHYGDQVFEDALIRVIPVDDGWRLFAENPLVSGVLELPADDSPWQLSLDYLRLPAQDSDELEASGQESSPEDVLSGLDPRLLPPLDIHLAEFRQGERHFGRWELSMRPAAEGVRIDNLRVALGDASIYDVEDNAEGAHMQWLYDGDQHETRFNGMFETINLAETLISLGYDAHIESERARFAADLSWPGSPAAFALPILNGEVRLRINEGRFVNIDSGSSRLFGALNLDSLVRRLQLDFSDLFGRGLSYDNIDGQLQFDSGRLSTMDRLLISGPSSKIRLEGELDLQRQYIHADMLVSVPLSQNISVLAGLLGAWPIALSTYLAGRIFEDQVAGLTAVAYRLDGPLNDLDAEFIDADELGEVAGEPLPPAPIDEGLSEEPDAD